MSIQDCNDLEDYMRSYGELLAERATSTLDPLHVPGRDPMPPGWDELMAFLTPKKRVPFPAQADRIAAGVKAWNRQKALYLGADVGTGKTLQSIAMCHLHAAGRPYRALVMCPGHLSDKWAEEEILETVPGATATVIRDWKQALELLQDASGPIRHREPIAGAGRLAPAECSVSTGPGPHFAPDGTFLDQPYAFEDRSVEREGAGQVSRFIREVRPPAGPEWFIIPRDRAKLGAKWRHAFRRQRRKVEGKGVSVEYATCPRCGAIVADKDDNPLDPDALLKSRKRLACKGVVERWGADPLTGEPKPELSECGEPLWQWHRSKGFNRWPAADILGKMHWDYLILDEAHELKGGSEVAQANAAGRLIAAAEHVIALSGTLIGGYAWHLFPLMMRLAPRELVRQGFKWGDTMPFSRRYGRIETTVTTKEDNGRGGDDNACSKGSSRKAIEDFSPGIMPAAYADLLIDKALFLQLEDVAPNLPTLTEEIVPVSLDADVQAAYKDMEDDLRDELKAMLVKGDKRLLGTLLRALIAYPDMPFDWHTLGYYAHEDEGGGFIGVHTPASFDPSRAFAKEDTLEAVVLREKGQGRQCWIFCEMTDKKDVQQRLLDRFELAGLDAAVLRSSVALEKRRDWIAANAPGKDAIFCNPKLIETGVDLFDKRKRRFNFPTLIFYQLSWKTFTLMQASGRHWRIGQWKPCKTIYLYSSRTMQEHQFNLVGQKKAASEALNGKFSAEGMAAMAADTDPGLALAKALMDNVGPTRDWKANLGFAPPPTAGEPRSPAVNPEPEPAATFGDLHLSADDLARLEALVASYKTA
jgi:hypothetical protein